MSRQIGIDTIHLRRTPRVAHTDYVTSDPLKRHLKETMPEKGCFEDRWEMDFLWVTNDGPVGWDKRGRVTDMGHADFLEGGRDRRMPKPCPFNDVEEVWAFDAVKEYGLTDEQQLIAYYEEFYQTGQKKKGNQVFTGGYYNTLISGAIQTFGWEMLLEAAFDQQKFARVLDSFFRQTMHHIKAWAKTSIEVFISHDDMVWTEGPFIHPDFYRREIFPRYRELWAVLNKAGKRVLYCSDGDWTQFLPDIAAAGADGFIFEPVVSLDAAVEQFGQTHVIVGSKLDCRTLTFGAADQIKREIDETMKLTKGCPGFMFAVGNHVPSNVPIDNALFYLHYLTKNWQR